MNSSFLIDTPIKKRWPLFCVLIIFAIIKLPHLHYAFYWDECYPYAAAIKDLHQHSTSLLPGLLTPNYQKATHCFFMHLRHYGCTFSAAQTGRYMHSHL